MTDPASIYDEIAGLPPDERIPYLVDALARARGPEEADPLYGQIGGSVLLPVWLTLWDRRRQVVPHDDLLRLCSFNSPIPQLRHAVFELRLRLTRSHWHIKNIRSVGYIVERRSYEIDR